MSLYTYVTYIMIFNCAFLRNYLTQTFQIIIVLDESQNAKMKIFLVVITFYIQ